MYELNFLCCIQNAVNMCRTCNRVLVHDVRKMIKIPVYRTNLLRNLGNLIIFVLFVSVVTSVSVIVHYACTVEHLYRTLWTTVNIIPVFRGFVENNRLLTRFEAFHPSLCR